MSRFLSKINIKSKRETAASATIEFLFVILLFFLALLIVIDFGFYFASRNAYASAAQSGARLAAIYGGAGFTPIANKYGVTEIDSQCNAVGATDPVSCAVVRSIASSNMSIASHVTSVRCGPDRTTVLGERVWCEVVWVHDGVPGSLVSAALRNNTIRISAESEVVTRP